MYKKLDLYRYVAFPENPGPRKVLDRIVIGYWEPKEGPAVVRDFTFTDERGHTTNFRNARVIGQTLSKVIRDQEGCGFERAVGFGKGC